MKHLFFSILCCVAQLAYAQLPDSCNTVLWGVTNAKGDTSYLLGTFHEFGNSFVDRYGMGRIDQKADVIAEESIPRQIDKAVRLTDNWVKDLSRNDRKQISYYMKQMKLGYKLKQFRNVPPSWLIYLLQQEMTKQECHTWTEDDFVGMDEYIINGAITNKKRLVGLESADDTFNVINMMSGAQNNEDLISITKLKDMAINDTKYRDTTRTVCQEADNYRYLRINYHFSRPSTADDPEYKIMLDQRNNAWMPTVKALIDSSKAFIGVGFKHLCYQQGLVMQLKNSGYNIFPITLRERPVHYNRPKNRRK